MIPSFVHGPIAPVFTAFNQDGSFDEKGQREFLAFLMERGGIAAYFLRCGMGQMYAFQYDEVKQIAKAAREQLGSLPLIVGTTGIWDRNRDKLPDPGVFLRQAIELSQYAESVGVDGVVHTIPEGLQRNENETPAEATLRYFEAVTKAIKVPVFIYQPPATSPEYMVTPESIRELSDLPQMSGIKCSTADAHYLTNLAWALRDKDFALVTGNETAFLCGLGLGSPAVIGQGSTVNPQLLRVVQDRYEAGDFAGALEAQRSVNLLCEKAVNPTEFFKRYAAEKGYEVQPYARTMGSNPYEKQTPQELTQERYDGYKQLLEQELARFN